MKPAKALTVLGLFQFLAGPGLHALASASVGFKQAQSYPVGTTPSAVAIGDFNGDGNTDLAVCNFGDPTVGDDGNVSVLLGKGDATFQPATNFTAVKNCTDLLAGDFDSDGRSDLLVVRAGDPNLADNGGATIFLGNGDGTFRKGQTLAPGKNPSAASVADLYGDHRWISYSQTGTTAQ